LLSRQGPSAPHADRLRARIEQTPTELHIIACDVTDRDALAAALATIPAYRPLTGVVHAAAALDDGLLNSIGPQQLSTVLGAKSHAAWHLHELTADCDLSMFTLFSSMASVAPSAGQAVYAAANAHVDALAYTRAAKGLVAKSIAWGRWETPSVLTGRLSSGDKARMKRAGLLGMTDQHGLALFDAAHRAPAAALAAARLDPDTWAYQDPPALLRERVRRRSPQIDMTRKAVADSAPHPAKTLITDLAELTASRRDDVLLDLVRSNVAVVLGYQPSDAVDAVDADLSFRDLGFDSLTSVELRNRLRAAVGMRVSPTAVFDYPTARALARYLAEKCPTAAPAAPAASVDDRRHGMVDILLRQAVATGTLATFLDRMAELAQFVPAATSQDVREPVRLVTRTADSPTYYCLPSLFGKSSYESFWKLSEILAGGPEVVLLPHLGYVEGEPLPSTADDAVALHADAVLAHQPPDEPFVLLGYSSAAPMAEALAASLHRRGRPPLGTVLIDPFNLGKEALCHDSVGPLLHELVARNTELGDLGMSWALAMGRYATFTWPRSTVSGSEHAGPVHIIRATRDVDGTPRCIEDAPAASTEAIHNVDADHFSILNAEAGQTATLICEWVATLTITDDAPAAVKPVAAEAI
jgi:acyl carrier protein